MKKPTGHILVTEVKQLLGFNNIKTVYTRAVLCWSVIKAKYSTQNIR